MIAALDHAGVRPRPGASHNDKRNWSGRFANRCAVSFADCFRRTGLTKKTIRPVSLAEGTEPLTPLGSGTRKRIDVTVVDEILGLEIGVSLKGLNFRDEGSGNFDKNLTGRLYELGDEMRLVHEHLPHAFMAGILLLPIEAALDKSGDRDLLLRPRRPEAERKNRSPGPGARRALRPLRCRFRRPLCRRRHDGFPARRRPVLRCRRRPTAPGPPDRRGDALTMQQVADVIVERARYEETDDLGNRRARRLTGATPCRGALSHTLLRSAITPELALPHDLDTPARGHEAHRSSARRGAGSPPAWEASSQSVSLVAFQPDKCERARSSHGRIRASFLPERRGPDFPVTPGHEGGSARLRHGAPRRSLSSGAVSSAGPPA